MKMVSNNQQRHFFNPNVLPNRLLCKAVSHLSFTVVCLVAQQPD